MDGIDAALTDIEGSPPDIAVRLVLYRCFPYPPGLPERIRRAATPETCRADDLCHLNAYLGELFARAATRIMEEAGVRAGAVELIGSHGQTVYHIPEPVKETQPEGKLGIRSTFQIGEAAVIAERTGIPTVSNFRARDMAAGGVGAPLLPYLHHLLFGDTDSDRIVVNIGGIANITVLPRGKTVETVTAFDTGPGNVIIDGLMREYTGEANAFDRDGNLARRGCTHPYFLNYLLSHPFLTQPPPKAAERDMFGERYLKHVREKADGQNISSEDLIRTASGFVAESIAAQYRNFVFPECKAHTAIICGGGAMNTFLMELLSRALPDIEVAASSGYGVDPMAVEAIGFAFLAHETYHHRAGNLTRVTGAAKPVVLGSITP